MKKIALGLVGVMALATLSGCGKGTSKYLLDVDYSEYVTLCDYKGIEATRVIYDISEEELQEAIEEGLYDYVDYDIITDRSIEIGDYANIDYTTTVDGEESEYYSGEEEDILVGEEYIYPEVEEALVGMKTGESKTVEIVLTEDFADEEDIGKSASVEFTVNEISLEIIPEYNEEFVKENTEFDSMEDYEESLKEELMSYKEEEYKYETISEIFDFILNNSEFNGYPEELYKLCEENYDNNSAYYASMYGMELEEYMELFEIDDATRKMEILGSVNQELVIGAIAQKEKIKCTDKDIKQFVDEIFEDYGYDSADEFMEDYSEQEIGNEVIYEKIADLLYANAKYIDITEEEYLEQEEDYFDDEEYLDKEGDEVNIPDEEDFDEEDDEELDGENSDEEDDNDGESDIQEEAE